MTDNTPQNKTENPENTPTALAQTTDTIRDGEPKSKALPQADALKERFKAGSIPLQTDFADVIDLANMGRQAVGGAEGQTGPADGFTLSSEGRLELKPNAAKGISVDQDGMAIKLKTISGLVMDKDGVSVKPKADSGIELKDSAGISIKVGNGISVDKDGIVVKVEGNKGLQVNNNGVSVKTGNGIKVDSNGVNIALAKGDANSNGGGGQGADGTTQGGGGGLTLSSKGLAVEPGDGIQINNHGLSIKLATNSGLSADETNGLKIIQDGGIQVGIKGISAKVNASKGLTVNPSSGIEVKDGWGIEFGSNGDLDAKAGQGITVNSDGIHVKASNGVSVNSSGVSVKIATNSGLKLADSDGLSVVANTKTGIQVNSNGVGLNNNAWIKMMCGLHNAEFYATEDRFAAFFCNEKEGCVAYVYGRAGWYMSMSKRDIGLSSNKPEIVVDIAGDGNALSVVVAWTSTKASVGNRFKCVVKSFMDSYSSILTSNLLAAP